MKTKSMNPMSRGKKIGLSILAIIIALVIACSVYVSVVISKAPKINTDNIYDVLSEASVIYDAQGNKVDRIYADENRTTVTYAELPDNLKNAFIALEDKTFWKHKGFNIVRILGAIKEAFTSGEVSGTSTISQQLARNLFLKESKSEHSMRRKIIEAYYTVILERNLSKKQILETYLNTIYLGNNANGVQAASQAYFSKNVQDLTLVESAALASLPQAPTEYALINMVELGDKPKDEKNILKKTPNGYYVINDSSKNRRKTCLKLMKEQGYISNAEFKKAVKIPLSKFINPNYSENIKASYFTDYAIDQVIEDMVKEHGMTKEHAREKVYNGGLKIYTTMDKQAQDVCEEEFANPANFPSAINMRKDGAGNFINQDGIIVMYNYHNLFDENGNCTFAADEVQKNKDGSLTIFAGRRLNLYDTTVGGKSDISIELKNMYINEDGDLYAIAGGYINVPQNMKKKTAEGDVIIKKEFIKQHDDWFIFNSDNTVTFTDKSYKLKQQVIQPQGAITILENKTGAIKAMVGGRNTEGRTLYNRAINPRQPGSAIKPLGVYAPAVQLGFEEHQAGRKHNFKDYGIDKQGTKYWGDYLTAGSIVLDEKTHIHGRDWPRNFDGSFRGPMTMKSGMALSINTVAVKTFLQVGTQYSADMIEKFGITTLKRDGNTNDMNPSALALGGMVQGTTTLEMASAYTAFPNGGVRHQPYVYTKVLDRKGNILLEKTPDQGKKVLDPGVAFILTDMLQEVVRNGGGYSAAISGVPVGGKTGTTSNAYDVWFDGFTPNYTAAVWIGNDVNIQLSDNSFVSTKLWHRIMSRIPNALKGSLPSKPSNVVSGGSAYYIQGTENGKVNLEKIKEEVKDKVVLICADSKLLPNPECTSLIEVTYEHGTEDQIPTEHCNIHKPGVKPPDATPGNGSQDDPNTPKPPAASGSPST